MYLDVNESNFQQEVLEFKGQVLVDFWASWCGPCQMLSPIIEEIESERKEIKVVKIDVDQNQNIALQYNISSIPAVLIFDEGKVVNTIIGFHQKQDYLKALK
ncbi:MAG: thioredoxin [Candidatus Shapirobacteria bacterium]|jgi:thioredoxin 1|nr:thioredoxin [Candidatus Shapirobacteria bacterium]